MMEERMIKSRLRAIGPEGNSDLIALSLKAFRDLNTNKDPKKIVNGFNIWPIKTFGSSLNLGLVGKCQD